MLMLLSAALFAAPIVHMYRRDGLAPLFILGFLLFIFSTRMISATYIGIFGPVYAEHFQRFIQADGWSTLAFTLSLIVVVIAAMLMLSARSLNPHIAPPKSIRKDSLGRLAFIGYTGFMLILYGDMIWRGNIPLLSLMERNVYTSLYAGFFHKSLFEFLYIFSFMMGFFFVRPRIGGDTYEIKFFGLLASLYLYFLLTGHRFSAFFTATAYFLIPVGAVMIQERLKKLPPTRSPIRARQVLTLIKAAAPALGALLVGMVVFSLYNSLFNVRVYSDPGQALVQRSLIQPTELWWATWEHSVKGRGLDQAQAWMLMFTDPIDASRNTGIQYLMVRELGYERTAVLLNGGEQYAGGYPEVLFEALGPVAAWPAILIFAFTTIFFLRLAVTSVCNQRPATAAISITLFYGFSVLYVGGMLNFLLAYTLLAKFVILGLCLVFERRRATRRLRAAITPRSA